MRYGFWLYCISLSLPACGQGTSPTSSSAPASTPDVASLADESCLGFTLLGSHYSPGGTTLPHTCKPFDPVTNNPYAVRCVDAIPGYRTQYSGDEYCILPPPPDKGVQLGAHPQGAGYWEKMWAGDLSDYSNPAFTKTFEVDPNTEVVQNFNANAGNAEAHNYFRLDSRMRSGSHHLASWFNASSAPEGWQALADSNLGIGTSATFYNVQRESSDRPSSTNLAPEDQGLGMPFAANTSIGMQLHHINVGREKLLREVWINVWWVPDGEVVKPVQFTGVNAPIDYPPGQLIDNTATATATGDTRVLSIFGHRHAWTTRFSAQVVRANGDIEEVYDSFDWLEMPTYQLDSLTTNPPPDVQAKKDGAVSGEFVLHAGDKLEGTCHVDTTAAAAAKLGVPVPTSNLHFANQAFGAEMCILNLETTGAPLTMTFGQ